MRKKNTFMIVVSMLIGTLFIGTAMTSAVAGSVSSLPSNETSGGCPDCYCSVDFAVDYAWEHIDAIPDIDWEHPYPITKFISDLTVWAGDYASELKNGFEISGFQAEFLIAKAVKDATEYAVQEVIDNLDEILPIYSPAVFITAFTKAVIYYLKLYCDGKVIEDISENTNNFDTVKASLSTPRNRLLTNIFLFKFLKHFANVFSILRYQ